MFWRASVSFAKSVRTIFGGMDLVRFRDALATRKRLRSRWINKKASHRNRVPWVAVTPLPTLWKTLIQSFATDILKFSRTKNNWARWKTSWTIWSQISKSRRSKFLRTHNTLTMRTSHMKIWKTCPFGTTAVRGTRKTGSLTIRVWSSPFKLRTAPT